MRIRAGLLSAVVTVMALACATGGPELPADILRLGNVRLATAQEAQGTISGAHAIRSAEREGYGYEQPAAYLVVPAGLAASHRFEDPVRGAMAWIVRWNGLGLSDPLPVAADGSIPSRAPLQYLYVTIDPFTGEFIDATYME